MIIFQAETSLFQLAMKKNGTGKPHFKVEQVTAISVSDTKQIKSTPSIQKIRLVYVFIIKIFYIFNISLKINSNNIYFSSSTDKDSMDSSSKHPSTTDGGGPDMRGSRKTLVGSMPIDISAATFLDVAVLRCLFITHWQEEGVYWALHYMYNR